MGIDEYIEKDVTDTESILNFVNSIEKNKSELVLSTKGKVVGAILTAEQYEWFLDQIDAQQDIEEINSRSKDRQGSQSLDDFKKELDK
ncbi:hypothetical protein ACJJIW_05430 [Microbulbifer sp. JMSA004]|uniref:hypothetical protein n=1 Tax=unclassified Microbulbifer TaxID=2619833 RepID=UPI0024ACFF1B|nr:hypothetical protein [Microbulbifer sp. VAAF005]WHI44674.1 hypothetical protein P0078_13050 [Microbulbifer sp. VAAF005]